MESQKQTAMLRGAGERAMPPADAIKNLVCALFEAVRCVAPNFSWGVREHRNVQQCRHGSVMDL